MKEVAWGGDDENPLGIDLEGDTVSLASSLSRQELRRVASNLGQQVQVSFFNNTPYDPS
jgi:hypothetical protein